MKWVTPFFLLLGVSTIAFAQDLQLRQKAVALLERANKVSTAPNLPNLERTDSFRVLDSNSGPREGTFTRVVIQGTGRREETTFGDYHSINIWTRGHVATTQTKDLAPPEVVTLMRLTPIYQVRFDHEDVIRSITANDVGGRSLRCIEFNTTPVRRTRTTKSALMRPMEPLPPKGWGPSRSKTASSFPSRGRSCPGRSNIRTPASPSSK